MLIFEAQDPQKNYYLQIHRIADDTRLEPKNIFNVEENKYFNSLTSEKRKIEYLHSRSALKLLLSLKTGALPRDIHFKKIGEGKLVLNPNIENFDFNISHSGNYFAIIFSESGKVGIDIEKIRASQNLSQISSEYFSTAENKLIQEEKNPAIQFEIFSKLWSGKEALIKTFGGGVFKNVQDVEINIENWKIKKLPLSFGDLSLWQLAFYPQIEGYICSVGFKSST